MKADYSKENLKKIISESYSFAQAIRKLGLRDVGSNFATIKKKVEQYNIDVSHFTGQRWNIGKTEKDDNRIYSKNIEDVFENNVPIKSSNLKEKLFTLGYKEKKCECCGITEWQGKPLTLELHHIDGNHYNNGLSNLQILCPNCHSQTETFRSRIKSKTMPQYKNIDEHKLSEKYCLNCGKLFHPANKRNKFCSIDCYKEYRKKESDSNVVYEDELKTLINEYKTISEIAKKLNLSRPTVRKYLEKYGLLGKIKD